MSLPSERQSGLKQILVLSLFGILSKEKGNKMTTPIMKYFEYKHLPDKLQEVSKPTCELAQLMEDTLPDGPEKSAGLRKLLEAKDCLVRAALC